MPNNKYADIEALVRKKGISPSAAARELGYDAEFQFRFNKEHGAVKLRNRNSDINRLNNSALQTHGPSSRIKVEPGHEYHHVRKLSQYAPFFKNLSKKAAKELARYAAKDLGLPLGDHESNGKSVESKVHTKHHQWERQNGYTGKNLPKMSSPEIRKLLDSPLIADRKYAMRLFLKNEQPKINLNLQRLQQAANFAAKRGPGMALRAANPYIQYIPEIDQATGGHINNTINNGFDYLRSLAVQRLQQLANSYASSKPLQGGSNVDYGQ